MLYYIKVIILADVPDLTRITRLSEISTRLPSHCTDTDMSDYYYYSPTTSPSTSPPTTTHTTSAAHTSVLKTGPTIRNIYAYDEYLHGLYARQLKTALEV